MNAEDDPDGEERVFQRIPCQAGSAEGTPDALDGGEEGRFSVADVVDGDLPVIAG